MAIGRLGKGIRGRPGRYVSSDLTEPSAAFIAVAGSQATATEIAALGGDWATWEAAFHTTVVASGKVGWSNYWWDRWALATPVAFSLDGLSSGYGFFSSGAHYDIARIHYQKYLQNRVVNPTRAATFLERANAYAYHYRQRALVAEPSYGLTTAHAIFDGICLHYLIDPTHPDHIESKNAVGIHADYKNSGSILDMFAHPEVSAHAGREIARPLIAMILATYINAPTALGSDVTWGVRGITTIPVLIQQCLDDFNYRPTALQTCNDTIVHYDHPGCLRSAIHDYMDKQFQTAMVADAFIHALELVPSLLSASMITAIKTQLRDIANYMWQTYDRYSMCYPYPEGAGISTCHGTEAEGWSPGEGCGPSPDGDGHMLCFLGKLWKLTGDVTYKTRATTIMSGMVRSQYWIDTGLTNPEWQANRSAKQHTVFYIPQNAASLLTMAADAVPVVPVCSVEPAISGTLTSGSTLTSTTGTWSNTPTLYHYQWMCCRNGHEYVYVPAAGVYVYGDDEPNQPVGSDQNTYVLQAADIGKTIMCIVRASNASGYGCEAVSNQTAEVT